MEPSPSRRPLRAAAFIGLAIATVLAAGVVVYHRPSFRTPAGAVTTDSTATDLGTSLVQVDVSTSWNMLGGRARSEQTSTIISNGTKK